MHSQRNFVLNIGFGRSPTSIFEVGFEKSDSKNCELVPTCPACYDCKCKNFLNRKITVRFKLNLKTDGLNCKMIFKSGERIERLHSCSKQGRRIYNVCICKQCFRLYKNTFCVAKCLLGCAQTPCVLYPLDAGCAIASLKVDRKVHHDLAQGERGSLVKNTDL